MIPQITEIKGKFPEYATLSQATVTLNDMGDKTISTQIKIDGGIAPDFSYDWEVEFQGERYIQPLREPQASKGNESICSVIDLTFYHKTIYDLKRYFFVEMASTGSGTAMADKYIADLNVNLEQFKVALQDVLDFYFKGENRIEVKLYGKGTGIYAEEKQYVQIQYTHIWDVVQKIYEIFGVRWSIEGREIKIGYPTEEVAHTFEYGFEGGLLKVERQVQSADIRNSLLGRGGSKNLPYRYFKETDPNNPSFQGDPDAIPELANIYFAELRGKTFRDYVKGWKAKHYGGTPMSEPTEAYTKGYTDTTFNPIEYVEDKNSIDKYGLLQGGLENQEDIYPTIQGVEVDGLGRVDEIVGAEQVTVDENEDGSANENILVTQDIATSSNEITSYISKGKQIVDVRSEDFHIENGEVAHFIKSPSVEALCRCYYTKTDYYRHGKYESRGWYSAKKIGCDLIEYHIYDATSNEEIQDIANVPNDTNLYIIYKVSYYDYPKGYDNTEYDGVTGTWRGSELEYDDKCYVTININSNVDCNNVNGIVLGNYTNGNIRKFEKVSISANNTKTLTIESDTFEVPEDGATNVDVPINIIVDKSGEGLYEFEKTVKAVNVDTNEVISSINIPQGKYYLRVSVDIRNNSTSAQTYKVELMPSYVYFPTDSEEFKPTFYIYVKNIWNTTRNEGESNEAYTNRVWASILGDREGNEAKVVFTTGWLAGHSDYEFVIRSVEYAGDKGVQSEDGIPAEWKIELIKSDAELETTGKWIPSTTQQANKGDKFFFIGIDMPHEYTLWAEQAVDNYKSDQLLETAHIKPTWVVQTDKVRLNQLQEGESELLLNALKIGNSLRLADTRFTNRVAQTLYLQSVTYTWQEGTNIVPDVEVVLSDKVTTSTNPVAKLQGEVDALTKQVGSISNIQQVVRAIGDKLYLRKDGFEEVSNSPTEFNKLVSSRGYRQGAVGGNGWGLRSEQGKGIIEVDKLIVRDEMQVNSLVVNQVSAIGGKEILSAASITCSRVETTEQGFKCYFDQKRGSVANLFQVHDIAYSQVFNPNDITVKFYKREVIEVGDNYILLSLEGYGSGAPQVGDVIAQYGNTDTENNANRQYVIIRDVIGGGYERMLSDLNSVDADGVEYYFAGRLDGGKPRWFVGDAEGDFAEWKDGTLNIKGKVVFQSGSSGLENLDEWAEKQQQIDNTLAEAKNYTDTAVKGLQDQLDGKVESYFYDYDPTPDKSPTKEWDTDELKAAHLNDTFTNTENGRSWRWLLKDGEYQWVEIADTQSAEALAKAQEALNIANGKVAVFVTEEVPKTPYNKGDFWLTNNRIKRSIMTRTESGFSYIEDWVFAEDSHEYTDNKIAEYRATVDATVAELDEAIATAESNANKYTDEGKKALQSSIDALESAKANIEDVYNKASVDGMVSTAEQKAIAKAQELANAAQRLAEETAKAYADGAVSDSEAETLKKYQEALAEAQEAMAKANEAMEEAESKAEIFTEQPTSYKKNDLWILEKEMSLGGYGNLLDVNGVQLISSDNFVLQAIVRTIYPIGTIMVATNSSDTFNYADWIKKDNYVDELSTNRNWFDAQYTTDNKPHNGVKVGDQFVPYDAQHQVYTYTDNGWVLTSDSTQTIIDGGLITSGTIQLGDTNATAKAGITGGGTSDDSVRIWAGSGEEDMANANFRVTQGGKLTAKEADIRGTVNAESGTFKNGVFENVTLNGSISSPFQSYEGTTLTISVGSQFTQWNRNIKNDKVVNGEKYLAWVNTADETFYSKVADTPIGFNEFYQLISMVGNSFKVVSLNQYSVYDISNALIGFNGIGKHDNLAITVDSDKREFSAEELDWSPANSGRIVRLVNAPYNGQQTVGYAKLYAPSGKYFFEDGERYDSITFSNQIVELIGYGTNDAFYGWIVTNRKDISTEKSYGSSPKVLYQGVINNNELTKFWSAQIEKTRSGHFAYLNKTNKKITILVRKRNSSVISDYRGLNNVDNWAVMANGATVFNLQYLPNQEITLDGGVTEYWECISFDLNYSDNNHIVFQVISTANWASMTTTNE